VPSEVGPAISPKVLLADPIARDELQLVAVLVRLADYQRRLERVTAIVQHFDTLRPHRLDHVPVIGLARLDRFEHRLGDGALVEPFLDLLGEAFAVRLSVVEDGDRLVAPTLGEQIARDAALEVVSTDHTEHVGEALAR
jgi:hypothetical protein